MNSIRGEVPFAIEGEPYKLCLTLGALAEIESGLGLASLADLEKRLRAPSVADLAIVLAALLSGGGHEISAEELSERQVDLNAAAQAIADAFASAGLGARNDEDAVDGVARVRCVRARLVTARVLATLAVEWLALIAPRGAQPPSRAELERLLERENKEVVSPLRGEIGLSGEQREPLAIRERVVR